MELGTISARTKRSKENGRKGKELDGSFSNINRKCKNRNSLKLKI